MARAERPTSGPDFMRGVSGGVILGLPLVYTQEVWLHGATLPLLGIAGVLVVSFGLNLTLSRYVGFERGRTFRPLEDAVVGFGCSFVLAAALLFLIGRIDLSTPIDNVFGMIALASVPTSLGFALGNALAPAGGGEGADQMKGHAGELLAAGAGAVVLSLNIAPTEEPVLIAYQIDPLRLLAIVAVSLTLSFLIVFYAEFGGRHQRAQSVGAVQSPTVETMLAYLVAFVVAGLELLSFGEIDGINRTSLAEVVVLGFPASVGAALGRLVV
ncbi:MAG: TIGR02587 family membrane protein [Actinomycetota bacterium]